MASSRIPTPKHEAILQRKRAASNAEPENGRSSVRVRVGESSDEDYERMPPTRDEYIKHVIQQGPANPSYEACIKELIERHLPRGLIEERMRRAAHEILDPVYVTQERRDAATETLLPHIVEAAMGCIPGMQPTRSRRRGNLGNGNGRRHPFQIRGLSRRLRGHSPVVDLTLVKQEPHDASPGLVDVHINRELPLPNSTTPILDLLLEPRQSLRIQNRKAAAHQLVEALYERDNRMVYGFRTPLTTAVPYSHRRWDRAATTSRVMNGWYVKKRKLVEEQDVRDNIEMQLREFIRANRDHFPELAMCDFMR